MHKLQIVPFDVAQDLKELGFDWGVKYAYNNTGVLWDATYINNQELTSSLRYSYAAPEQTLVCKWFRDVHKLHLDVRTAFSYSLEQVYYFNEMRHVVKFQDKHIWDGFVFKNNQVNNYEEAELEGIREAIKYLKKNESTSKI